MQHRRVDVLVPDELLEAARQAAARATDAEGTSIPVGDVVRRALAELAGVAVPPSPRRGWPKGRPRGPRGAQRSPVAA